MQNFRLWGDSLVVLEKILVLAAKFLVYSMATDAKTAPNNQNGCCYFDFIACGFICQVGCQGIWLLNIRELVGFFLWFWWKKQGISGGNRPAPVCYNGIMAYIRKFKTGSGATGVQVCYKEQGKVVKTVHVGSASSEARLEKLLRKAQEIIDGEKRPLFNLDKFNKKS